ncbi:hypothetical protein [Rothia aerolata]|uniref:hypothetical protein n=1 Tax=Rothia aerolata TaxID=1812262 RepID=UPI0035A23C36
MNRLRYTYETHEKAAPRYTNYEIARKRILIVCTTLATGTFVTSLFAVADSKSPGPVSVGLFAALATFAAFIGDVLDFSRKQQRHNEVPLT